MVKFGREVGVPEGVGVEIFCRNVWRKVTGRYKVWVARMFHVERRRCRDKVQGRQANQRWLKGPTSIGWAGSVGVLRLRSLQSAQAAPLRMTGFGLVEENGQRQKRKADPPLREG